MSPWGRRAGPQREGCCLPGTSSLRQVGGKAGGAAVLQRALQGAGLGERGDLRDRGLDCVPPLAGQPAAAAAGAAALRPHGQADAGPVPGAARAAAAGRQRVFSHRLLRAAPGGGRERQEEDARQVRAGTGAWGIFLGGGETRTHPFHPLLGGPTSSPPPRTKENGLDRDPLHPEHLSKRPCTMSPAQRYSPSNGLNHPPNGLGHPPPAAPPLPQHYRLEDMAMAHHYRDAYRHPDPRELRERQRPAGEWWHPPGAGAGGGTGEHTHAAPGRGGLTPAPRLPCSGARDAAGGGDRPPAHRPGMGGGVETPQQRK